MVTKCLKLLSKSSLLAQWTTKGSLAGCLQGKTQWFNLSRRTSVPLTCKELKAAVPLTGIKRTKQVKASALLNTRRGPCLTEAWMAAACIGVLPLTIRSIARRIFRENTKDWYRRSKEGRIAATASLWPSPLESSQVSQTPLLTTTGTLSNRGRGWRSSSNELWISLKRNSKRF